MVQKLFLISCLFSFCLKTAAQGTDQKATDSIKNFKLTALPVLFFLPETGLGYGALGVGTFRFKNESEESRPSSAQLAVSYTTKNQLLIFAPYEIYWKDEQWRLVGELGFFKYFYNFYGLGVNSNEADFETYEVTFPRLRASLLNEVWPNISIGLGYELDIYYDFASKENGILEATEIAGKNGGTVSNLGLLLFYDSRDDIFQPSKGFFIQAGAFSAMRFLGSSFSYSKFSLDMRFYQKLKGEHLLATNLFLANNGEGTPLYDLNRLGTNRTRGFNDRRFQDNGELSFATEYRFPISGRFGGVLFGATGTVAQDFNGLFSARYRNTAGAGLRYTINKKDGIRIRIDYGQSAEGGNFYFTIREAF